MDSGLQEKLLGVKKAVELCRAAEMTKSQVCEMQGQHKQSHADAVQNRGNSGSSGSNKHREVQRHANNDQNDKGAHSNKNKINCFSCGAANEIRKCPAYGKSCLKCGTKKHFAKQCRIKIEKTQVSCVLLKNKAHDCLLIDSVNTNENSKRSWCELSLKINR